MEKVSKAFTKKLKHGRLIKKHDMSFDETTFGDVAQSIYVDAHNALMRFLEIPKLEIQFYKNDIH